MIGLNMRASFLIFFLLFFSTSCNESQNPPQLINPHYSQQFVLHADTKKICSTSLDSLTRQRSAEPDFLKNLLQTAPQPFLCAHAVTEQIAQYFTEISKEIDSQLKNAIALYDVAIIGAGPQAAILAINLMNSGLKIIIVEKKDIFAKHFHSTMFNLTRPEPPSGQESGHPFPGAPVQLNDYSLLDNRKHSIALGLWCQTGLSLFASNAAYLNSELVQIKNIDNNSYALDLKNGRTIYSKSVVFATGFGEPTAKLDTATLNWLKQSKEKALEDPMPPVLFIDDFIERLEYKRQKKQSATHDFLQKKVAIIGARNGGISVFNYLSGQASDIAYEYGNKKELPQIVWFVSKQAKSNNVEQITTHVDFMRPINQNGKTAVELHFKNAGTDEIRVVDHAIVAGGYKSSLSNLLQPLLKNSSLQSKIIDIKATPKVQGSSEIIARQLLKGTTQSTLFFVGAAMDPSSTPPLIYYAYQTQEFAKILVSALKK